jgi:ubiquinone/menaquinone biosynthesis C-methylase UbiE
MFDDTIDAVRNWRRNLVGNLGGEVLEIGSGSGSNFALYRRAAHVWAIEPDAGRFAAAQKAAAGARVPVEVRQAPAEDLPFANASFDHVVSSLVFCSVADPWQALREIERVLRPHGVLHMLEHVRPGFAPAAWVAGAITPAWSKVAGNCHLDRRTVELLRQEGWQVRIRRQIGVFVRMEATRATPGHGSRAQPEM